MIIMLNTVALTLVWVGIDNRTEAIVEKTQAFFNVTYIIECGLKLTAYQK
jgi:hypothetical protein